MFTVHSIKLPSKYLPLYPINIALSTHQRSLFLYRMAIDTESHKCTKNRDYGVLSPKWDTYIILPRVKELLEREGVEKKILKARCWERFLQMVSSHHDMVGVLVKP